MLTPHARIQVFAQTQRGLSLIEMMISITIGLIILSAMATLFSNQSKVRSELDKSNRMIDNGRYALEVFTDNLNMAGFYGSYEPASGVPAAVAPCNLTTLTTNGATNLDVLRQPVQGYNATNAANQIAVLPAACATAAVAAAPAFTYTAGSATTLKAGSDILVLRRASTATPVTTAAAIATTTYLQVSSCTTDLTSYQITTGAPGTSSLGKDCVTPASLRPFIEQIYFVSPDNNVGDSIPTLKRIELDSASAWVTTPLVEGIEYMQVEYGVDGDSDGNGIVDMGVFDGAPDSYVQTCVDAQCWSRVVAVKIHLIARNIDPTTGYNDTKTYVLGAAGNFGPFNDPYKRHAYTKVVRLINPSGRVAPL